MHLFLEMIYCFTLNYHSKDSLFQATNRMHNVAPSAEGSLFHIIHTEITIIRKIIKNFFCSAYFSSQIAPSSEKFYKTKGKGENNMMGKSLDEKFTPNSQLFLKFENFYLIISFSHHVGIPFHKSTLRTIK